MSDDDTDSESTEPDFSGRKGSITFVWFLTSLAALAAGGILVVTVQRAGSAPQQAAGFAFAMAVAIIPYVFARSISMIASQ